MCERYGSPELKVSELLLFFHWLKCGRYGRFYGMVDALFITSALLAFMDERKADINRLKASRNKSEENSKNKIYGHTELALLYFTNILLKSASTQLTRRIQRNEELWEALKKAEYCKGQRIYTPLQRDILFEHLGAPDCWTVE